MNILNIEVVQGVEADKPVFRNLMQYYKYDSSDFTLEAPNPYGLYEYKYLDHYWTQHGINFEGRRAYLVRVNGELAGFTLVNGFNLGLEIQEDAQNIAEFFIMRKWRRQGVGKYVAHQIFQSFAGQWEVKQEKENIIAQRFWETTIDEFTNGNYHRLDSHPAWDGPVIRFRTQ